MTKQFYPFFRPYDAPRGKRVYISGAMTGIPEENYPAFAEAAAGLRALGYAVCSPAETTDILRNGGPMTHEDYLRFDFDRVLESDFLVALPGWEKSLGALSEILVAARVGTKVWAWATFDNYDRIRYEDVARAIGKREGDR